jgi:trans-L-3-hydroxyproline dehydratase
MRLETLDYHTAGEPLRIVTGGLPDIPGETMLAKRRFMQSNLDNVRKMLMLEPRGHADMYGAVITDPVTPDGDVGVLFMHNEGYSTMCGHGIIALVTAGLQHDLFTAADPRSIRIDTPAGRISASARLESSGTIRSVSFRNVPSFVLPDQCQVTIDGSPVEAVVAYGGAFYAYVEAAQLDLELVPAEAGRLIELGRKIKHAVNDAVDIRHPAGDADLGFLYGTIFVRTGESVTHSRNVCIFADGELDRSPTGTGVCGRAAIHHARGDIELGQVLHIESILGTAFDVRCIEEATVGSLAAVVAEVTGSAYMTGEHRFVVDPADPLPQGFFIR